MKENLTGQFDLSTTNYNKEIGQYYFSSTRTVDPANENEKCCSYCINAIHCSKK